MPNTTIINKFGKLTGWNNITVNLLGRDLEGISEVKYDDNTDMENAYGAGNFPIGYEEKNYKANVEISFLKEEMDALQTAIGSGNRVQDIDAFDVIVEYQLKNGVIQKDIIHNVKILGRGIEAKNGEGKIIEKPKMLCSHITWKAL